MTLSEKLRSAAKSPESWDLPGLLEDAANFVDATLQTCESLDSGLEELKSTGDVCGNRRETEYQKALRTGVKPAIWPPISMTSDELLHFRETCKR